MSLPRLVESKKQSSITVIMAFRIEIKHSTRLGSFKNWSCERWD